MASVRCEELDLDLSTQPSGLIDRSGNPVIKRIGSGNTTATPAGTSAVVFGPVTAQVNVLVRSLRGQAYVAKGSGVPVATAANSILIDTDGEAWVQLAAGESIAALAATVL